MARGLKFWMLEEEKLYYPCSENKGADQLRCSVPLFSHMQIVGFLMQRLISFNISFHQFSLVVGGAKNVYIRTGAIPNVKRTK